MDISNVYTLQMFTKIFAVFAGEIGVQGFQNCRVYMLSAFPMNSVGVPFMDFAGKL